MDYHGSELRETAHFRLLSPSNLLARSRSGTPGSGMRVLVIIVGILLFSGCAVGPGGSCAKNEDCASQLSCFVPSDEPSSVDPALTYRDLALRLQAHTCVSVDELQSAASALGLKAKQKAVRTKSVSRGVGVPTRTILA